MSCVYKYSVSQLIQIVVRPRRSERSGEDTEAMASVLVSAGPGQCPFHRRHEVTKNLAGKNWLVILHLGIFVSLVIVERESQGIFTFLKKRKM